MQTQWQPGDYFYWAGRGVGRVDTIGDDKIQVTFEKEGKQSVSAKLFGSAVPAPPNGFKVISAFEKDKLRVALESASPDLVDWIAADLSSEGINQICNQDLNLLLRPLFQTKPEWEKWRKRFTTTIKKHPRLGPPIGKGTKLCFPWMPADYVKKDKGFDENRDFSYNWKWITENKKKIPDDEQHRIRAYLTSQLESSKDLEILTKAAQFLENSGVQNMRTRVGRTALNILKLTDDFKILAAFNNQQLDFLLESLESSDPPVEVVISVLMHSKVSDALLVKHLTILGQKVGKERILESINTTMQAVPTAENLIEISLGLLKGLDLLPPALAPYEILLQILSVILDSPDYSNISNTTEQKLIRILSGSNFAWSSRILGLGFLALLSDVLDVSKSADAAFGFFKRFMDYKEITHFVELTALAYLRHNLVRMERERSLPISEAACLSVLATHQSAIEVKQQIIRDLAARPDEVHAENVSDQYDPVAKIKEYFVEEGSSPPQIAIHKLWGNRDGETLIFSILSELKSTYVSLKREHEKLVKKVESKSFAIEVADAEINQRAKIRQELIEKELSSKETALQRELYQLMGNASLRFSSRLHELDLDRDTTNQLEEEFRDSLAAVGIVLNGSIGDLVQYDPSLHEIVGPPSKQVEIIKPGFSCTIEGRNSVLKKALVRSV